MVQERQRALVCDEELGKAASGMEETDKEIFIFLENLNSGEESHRKRKRVTIYGLCLIFIF